MVVQALSARFLSAALLLQLTFVAAAVSAFANKVDFTIISGERIGVVKLGMTPEEVRRVMGNHDGAYSLPDCVNVEYADWKISSQPSEMVFCRIRIFYNKQKRVIQVSESTPRAAPRRGASYESILLDPPTKYQDLQQYRYAYKDRHVVYYDDVKGGIAYEFVLASKKDEPYDKQLSATLIHVPGVRVIPDSVER